MHLLFPDATAVVIDALDADLADPVHAKVPATRPARFYRVLRTGGPRRNLVVDGAQITVESWAESDEDAQGMAQEARGILHTLPGQVIGDVLVCRVDELSGPANLPDPLSDQPRYTQSFSVALRGSAASS